MLTITFTMLGDVVLARGISRYGEAIRDFSPVWNQIRDDFHRIEGEQFDTEGARAGTRWAPLSLAYEAWKRKHFPGRQLLVLTGRMWGVFTTGIGMKTEIEPMRLSMEPSEHKAVYHQQGTRTMPRRRVVDLTEEDKMGWMRMIHGYVFDKAREGHLT